MPDLALPRRRKEEVGQRIPDLRVVLGLVLANRESGWGSS